MKIGLIGCGFMGEAMLTAAIARGVAAPSDITVAEINEARRAAIGEAHGVRTTADAGAAVDGADVILFAVKPQEFSSIGDQLKGRFKPGQTIVSIMAGVPIAKIQRALGHSAIVRVMPNTPGVNRRGHERLDGDAGG